VHITHRKPTDQYKYHILHTNALVREFFDECALYHFIDRSPRPKEPIKTPHQRLISQAQRPPIAPAECPPENPPSAPGR